MPSVLLRVYDTRQSSADRLWLQMDVPVHYHREKQQGFTSLHSVVSHNGNEVRVAHLQDGQDAWLCGLSGKMFETAC